MPQSDSTTATAAFSPIFNSLTSNVFASTVIMSTVAGDSPLNTSDQEAFDWRALPENHPCYRYYKAKEDDAKKQICALPPPPYFDVSRQYIPDLDLSGRSRWNKCHILSLPKDIRIKIYEYVLTDPSNPDILVGIDRKPFSPSYKLTRAPVPELSFFHAGRQYPISLELLRTNRTIYNEALPILYRHVRFMPSDLEGLMPVFLNSLSPFARSCIRNIYICIPEVPHKSGQSRDRAKPFFHWAVTCAQIAKLNGSLQQVEIDGEWSVLESLVNRRAILFPLCKIKADKKFRPCARADSDPQEYDEAFAELLVEAGQQLKAAANLRETRTKAEAMERWKQNAERAQQEHKAREQKSRELNSPNPFLVPGRVDGSMEEWARWAEENIKRMEKDLGQVSGIKQFEKELEDHTAGDTAWIPDYDDQEPEDWDLISIASGTSTPKARPGSVMSKYSDETWPDTASTLVGGDDGEKSRNKREESDAQIIAEGEGWDYI